MKQSERFNRIKEEIECAYCFLTTHHLALLLIKHVAPNDCIAPSQLCEAMGWNEADVYVFDFEVM